MAEEKAYTVSIGGAAGQGIKFAGQMLAKVATRSGYNIYTYAEYPSLIRGGHNIVQVRISPEEVSAPTQNIDLLIALNQETIDLHLPDLTPGSGIIFDSESSEDLSKVRSDIGLFGLPLAKMATDSGSSELLTNTVALGAIVALLGGSLETLKALIAEVFTGKGEELVKINHQAAEVGYSFIKQNFASKIKPVLTPKEGVSVTMVVNGNQAASLGAIAAGLQYVSIYPMSPISEILHILAANQEEYGYIYRQPEDEIAAINMAIGASFAGARALTATSGGGFCLMSEGYGLAGMTETPLVIIEGMRGGPATGLPTWSGQGDLKFILHAHQGDFPRIVLAPGDGQEVYDLTRQAFNLADKYQTPVVILIDKNICENDQNFKPFENGSFQIDRGKFTKDFIPNYQRYALQPDGISERSVPGTGNYFIANSDEHDETGFSNEDPENRNSQVKKRMTKLATCAKEDMPKPQLFGPRNADLTLISWGSNKGAILSTLKSFDKVNFLHLNWLNPFPVEIVRNVLAEAKYIVDIECNYTGQLAELIREKTGIEITDKMLKSDGRPFFVEEIEKKIKSILK